MRLNLDLPRTRPKRRHAKGRKGARKSRGRGRNPGKTVWYVLGGISGYVLAKLVVGYAAYRYARSRPMTCPECNASVICEPLLAMPSFGKNGKAKNPGKAPKIR